MVLCRSSFKSITPMSIMTAINEKMESLWIEARNDALQKTKMTMESQPFEDVSPTKHGDVPLSC